ncbi:MAG: tetratricopeptide repeat protein [Deltaproteobacteria bacterium]|nr:tetratricopeptide repeat protein [Deltaproteobacteria bacterium]
MFKAILPAALLLLAGCASVQTPAWQARPEAGPDRGATAPQARPLSEKEKKDAAALEAWLKTMKADPREALKAYKNISASMPDRWQVNYDAAVAYLRLNEPELAVTELNAALGKDPAPGVVYGALGTAYASMGKKDDSAEAFKKAFEHGPGAEVLINAGGAYMEMGRFDEAIVYYREAEALAPKNPALHYNLGLWLYRKGLYRKALEEFNRASVKGLDDLKVSLCKAQTLLRLGRYEEALGLFKSAAQMDKNYFYLHKQIGIIYELYVGDLNKAFEHYNLYLSGIKGDKDVESWIEIVKARLAREGQ